MATKIYQEHKCVVTKCLGLLMDDISKYGYWAFWHPPGNDISGWRCRKQNLKEQLNSIKYLKKLSNSKIYNKPSWHGDKKIIDNAIRHYER